jgi:predicted phage-related endonuclease
MNAEEMARFHEERKGRICGSDLTHLLEADYGCRRRLWYDKKGIPADFPFHGNNHTRRGNILEPIVAQELSEREGFVMLPKSATGFFHHPEWDQGGCHVDQLMIDPRSGTRGVLEIKCPTQRTYFKWKKESVPPLGASLQVIWGMACTGARWGIVLAFNSDQWDYHLWHVEWDEATAQNLLVLAKEHVEAWEQKDNPLPILHPDNPACAQCPWRKRCQGLGIGWEIDLDRDGPVEPGVPDESVAPLMDQYVECKTNLAFWKSEKDRVEERVKEALKGRSKVFCSRGKVVCTVVQRKAYSVPATAYTQLRVIPNKPEVLSDGSEDASYDD